MRGRDLRLPLTPARSRRRRWRSIRLGSAPNLKHWTPRSPNWTLASARRGMRLISRDAEAAMLGHLSSIRAAIVGTVRNAEGIQKLRADLSRLFESFTLTDVEIALGHSSIKY